NLARFTAQANLDTSFGTGGVVTYTGDGPTFPTAAAVAPSGDIVTTSDIVYQPDTAGSNFRYLINRFQGGGVNTASISGVVFSDDNHDGIFDAGDTRLANRKIFLDLNKNGVLNAGEPTAISNASGVYTFSN